MPSYIVIGASRGIGQATAEHLAASGADILSVSRSPSSAGTWIEADIGSPQGVAKVVEAVGERPLDALLFLGGIWEKGAFTDDYSFMDSSTNETLTVLAVNLAAPILLAQGLAKNLAKSENARIVLMGSTSGLPNAATREVANTAAKFGLQGAGEALNLSLRAYGIATTVINPDNVATPEVEEDIAQGHFGDQIPIPLEDVIRTIDYLLGLSRHSVASAINLLQKTPER
ncbi:MAG: SDR family oxidoreductase [Pseudomonadota bacterium]